MKSDPEKEKPTKDDSKDSPSPIPTVELVEKVKPVPVTKEKTTITGLKKTVKIPDLSSIKESLSKQKSESESDQLTFENAAVTVGQLKAEWNSFMDGLKKARRDREFNTLNQQVVFHEDLSINLTLPNSFQSLTIEGLQQELLTYLRTKLNNGKISLHTEVEKTEDKKMIYTNSEKFDYLTKKYPALKELKARLDLDTDF